MGMTSFIADIGSQVLCMVLMFQIGSNLKGLTPYLIQTVSVGLNFKPCEMTCVHTHTHTHTHAHKGEYSILTSPVWVAVDKPQL